MNEKSKLTRKQKLTLLLAEIEELIVFIRQWEDKYADKIKQVHPKYTDSARNLVHYYALRSCKISGLQKRLGDLGLSRLSESEPHILASLSTTRSILMSMLKQKVKYPKVQPSFKRSRRLLSRNTKDLLGYRTKGRRTRIMVTLPDNATEDTELIRSLVECGMNCARINSAHGTTEEWMKMIDNVHAASERLRKKCKIIFDLSGPKIRTGIIPENTRSLKVQYQKDDDGNSIKPIQVIFGEPKKQDEEIPVIPLQNFARNLIAADTILQYTDSRSKMRWIVVRKIWENGFLAEFDKPTLFETGCPIAKNEEILFKIGELSESKRPLYLQENEILIIKKDLDLPTQFCQDDDEIEPSCLSCTEPAVFDMVKIGEPVVFDDGIIEGCIEAINENELVIRTTKVKGKSAKLKEDKGINFPHSDLQLSCLCERDREILPFLLQQADVIDLSFVNRPGDVAEIIQFMQTLPGERKIGLILKIETSSGFNNLPDIILEAMKVYPIGVMIARGDLAVEMGWENIGRIQEEILSVCRAAHVTSIWATQVLENLIKKGIPSRAEMSDIVMAKPADCIMLNKGIYITDGIKLLDTVLKKMNKKALALKPIQE
ncbi:MAG TPA: pyruvate kinase [Candidatus Cloacimonadota bacterium]|nr:pyruvate kinase [Candidatus Cloacimonadota bacterium]